MYSAVQSLSVSFGNVECSSVQISVARCSDCPVWYFPVQSGVVQSGEVKLSLRQSSPVKCSAVQFSLLNCCPAQSSPVQSIRWNLRPSSPILFVPVQFQFIPSQLSTFQSSLAQVHISQQQSSQVQSNAVQSSAIRKSSAQSRPIQSRTTNCHRVQDTVVLLSRVRNNNVHWGPSSQVRRYSKKPTFKPIQVYFSPVLSSDITPTQGRASTYIVVERSSLMIPWVTWAGHLGFTFNKSVPSNLKTNKNN